MPAGDYPAKSLARRSEEHTSELQSQSNLVCRLLLEKKTKLSVNKNVSLTDYPEPLSKLSAQISGNTQIAKYDATDIMAADMRHDTWTSHRQCMCKPRNLVS